MKDLTAEWIDAADEGTLILAKHDPNQPNASRFHTKISPEVSGSLATFLRSGDFEVHEYRKAGHANECWALVPTSGSFSGSLATAFTGSLQLSGHYDCLLIASGTVTPPHIMGEKSATLSSEGYSHVRKVDA
ncbi:MAG: hypothetical protein AB7P00_20310 [Sandaracinaceae bacterium]